MAFEPSKHVNGRMWPPGVSGNPNGRPVGSRTVFSQSFLKDLASVWAERGRAAMEKTAIDQPGVFFATCARLIGPEVKLTIEQQLPGNLRGRALLDAALVDQGRPPSLFKGRADPCSGRRSWRTQS